GFGWYKFPGQNYILSQARALEFTPLTSLADEECDPAFSPDRKQIDFSWDAGTTNNFEIYVKRVDVRPPLRLTTDLGKDRSAAWSPDGRYIAFIRQNGDSSKSYIVPVWDGAGHKLANTGPSVYWGGPVERQSLAWSPDGKFLVVMNRSS